MFLNSHSNISVCKDSTYVKYIIEKFEGTKLTYRNAMDANYPSSRIAREVYWMKELLTVFRCGVND